MNLIKRVSPHDRRFGVEIEFGIHPSDHTVNRTNLVRELFGMNSDSYRNADGWRLEYDGTEFELKSPILQGEEGYAILRDAMDLLRREGGYVTDEDGLHVHHDAPEFVHNPQLCLLIARSWKNNEEEIFEQVARRRRDGEPCPAWEPQDLEWLTQWAEGSQNEEAQYVTHERRDLNLAALSEHGSIEIRLHEGTLDPDVAIAWVQFGQRFIHRVLKRITPIPTENNLLSGIKLSKKAQRILEAKRAASYITPATSYGSPVGE